MAWALGFWEGKIRQQTEKGTPKEMTSERQPQRVAPAGWLEPGVVPNLWPPTLAPRAAFPAKPDSWPSSTCGISALGEKLITNTNQPCFFLLSPAPERCREWAGPLAGCTGNHTGET